LIQATLGVDAVVLEVFSEMAVDNFLRMVHRCVRIALSVGFLSVCCRARIVHHAVRAFVLLESVSLSTCSSSTSSAMAVAMISTMGLLGWFMAGTLEVLG
jgi:hypothetical protein